MDEKIRAFQEDLELFEDELSKYEYIVSLGKSQEPLDEAVKTETFQIKGCQSIVWVVPEFIEGKMVYKSESNTVIVSGLAAMVCTIFSNESPEDIVAFDGMKLESLGLSEIISPLRRSGLSSMVEAIQHYAKEQV